jgi:hypothetical protein
MPRRHRDLPSAPDHEVSLHRSTSTWRSCWPLCPVWGRTSRFVPSSRVAGHQRARDAPDLVRAVTRLRVPREQSPLWDASPRARPEAPGSRLPPLTSTARLSSHDRVDRSHEPADLPARSRAPGVRAHGNRIAGCAPRAPASAAPSASFDPLTYVGNLDEIEAYWCSDERRPASPDPPVLGPSLATPSHRPGLGSGLSSVRLHPRPRRRGHGRRHRPVVYA